MKNLKKILFLAIIFIFISIFASFNVSAQEETETLQRIKLIENTFTQYTWRLVTRTGVPVCTVVINHEGFPTGQETLAACNESWLALFPTPTVVVTGTPTPQPTSTPIVINQPSASNSFFNSL